MKLDVVVAAGLALAVLTACSGDDGSDCGGGECVACPASNPFACTGDTICVDEVCVPAFGRSYVFTITTGTLPSVDNMGASWDESGGLPDPYVELTIGSGTYTSPVVTDSVTPTWNFAAPVVAVQADTRMIVSVFDDDEPTAVRAWTCVADPLPVEYLRGGGFGCSGPGTLPGARVNATIAVVP
jgi:hypothetical protein